jgi:hypothetical protein
VKRESSPQDDASISGKAANAGLIDVTGLSLRELLNEVGGTGLDQALQRILNSEQASAGHNAFTNCI